MVDEDKYVCHKPNYLTTNPPPGNTRSKYQVLSNNMSIETLRSLEQVGIIEPIKYDSVNDYMKPFKSRLSYFHQKRHVP